MNEVVAQDKQLAPYEKAIQNSKERFDKIADKDLVSYDRESLFALQMLIKTDYALKVANQNPKSVILAMANVASTGLTLNPAYGLAYLVPRNGAIVLDISYKGLLQIATDTGSIKWGRAEVVHASDQFEYNGPAQAPVHKAQVFAMDRGDIIGAYCIAKTDEGDILTEVMTLEQLHEVRGKSEAWKRGSDGKKGPWDEFFSEMARKAVIKRAQKTWPRTDKSQRLAEAVEIANQAEGGYAFVDTQSDHIPPANLIGDDRKQRCDEAYEQYYASVDLIKEQIGIWQDTQDPDCLWTVAETWHGLPSAAQMDLNLAPSKGGVFTTFERDVIKTKLPRDVQE